jgi:hypothetical protein
MEIRGTLRKRLPGIGLFLCPEHVPCEALAEAFASMPLLL